ncbi:hypothetical protein [Streptomyces microflavus]|uniref:Uncharacterized protein n=1 Tax=Streptomyces microflavus TaxID=1919 RepID=A0A7H8MHV9_STRMI|nr:hypothetical protein [Streptomyces microflavus]QKW41733.1 hypothetical protein HUT09_03720 [Streptomyces microflavus]
MDSGWMAVWPVGAFFLGGLATQVTGWLNHRRQRAERAADEASVIQGRREEFELAHLVEFNGLLREAADRLFDLAGVVQRYRRAEVADALTAEHSAELHAASAALTVVRAAVSAQLGFILHDRVRMAAQMASASIAMTSSSVLDGENTEFEEVTAMTAAAYTALSARVRDIYAGRASV